jgi:hypothetical protein
LSGQADIHAFAMAAVEQAIDMSGEDVEYGVRLYACKCGVLDVTVAPLDELPRRQRCGQCGRPAYAKGPARRPYQGYLRMHAEHLARDAAADSRPPSPAAVDVKSASSSETNFVAAPSDEPLGRESGRQPAQSNRSPARQRAGWPSNSQPSVKK